MARQDHFYVNLPRTLGEVIDTCVSTLFSGGAQKYQDRKDFIVKSIQNLIEIEQQTNPILDKKLSKISAKSIEVKSRGNRIHDTIRTR